jgi:hypothetical protein
MPGEAGKVFRPFAEELLRSFSAAVCISVTGSCITGDFVSGISDINSVLVLNKIDMESSTPSSPFPASRKSASEPPHHDRGIHKTLSSMSSH